MAIVEVPGMGEVEFPDDMLDADIEAAIRKNLAPAPTPVGPPPSFGADLLRQAKLIGRDAASVIAAPVGMAMDLGVGARNMTEQGVRKYAPGLASKIDKVATGLGIPSGPGEPYALPSGEFQRSLTAAGVPEPQGVAEKGLSIARQFMLGGRMGSPTISKPAPAGFVKPAANLIRQQTLKNSQGAGYVVPPSTTNPSMTNKMLESVAGKNQMEQEASLANMEVTNKLVRQALKLADDRPLSPEELSSLRSQAAQSYEGLKSIGTVEGGGQFSKDLARIAETSRGAARSFPGLAKNEIEDVVKALDQPQFDASDAVDATRLLRENADSAFAKGDKSLGKAYREASNALEAAMERTLEKSGQTDLLKNFRESRQLIAKTYSVEKALNPSTGNVNATKLAAQLAKGKPLSGPLRTAAQFGQAFPKAAREIMDSGPVRNTDVIVGAGTAALSREPTYLLYPFLRQGVRAGLLSNAGQSLTTPGAMQLPPSAAMGLLPIEEQIRQGLLAQ